MAIISIAEQRDTGTGATPQGAPSGRPGVSLGGDVDPSAAPRQVKTHPRSQLSGQECRVAKSMPSAALLATKSCPTSPAHSWGLYLSRAGVLGPKKPSEPMVTS